jgi:hypothetical protein
VFLPLVPIAAVTGAAVVEDIMQARNPTDPFAGKPEIGAELRAALRAEC